MYQSSEPGSETTLPSAKIGIALGSLVCFSTIVIAILSIFELIARGWNSTGLMQTWLHLPHCIGHGPKFFSMNSILQEIDIP